MKTKVEIIAECGINHNGSLEIAKEMILSAKKVGADTVKFQLVDPDFYEKDSELYNIFLKNFLTIDEHKTLKDYAEKVGIGYLCTPSDVDMADALVHFVGVDRLKVASDSAQDPKLLRYIGMIKMPYIISTGHIESANLSSWLKTLPKRGTVLHCISKYPCPDEEANVSQVRTLQELTEMPVGYSDHTAGIIAPVLAVTLGARIIEKHFKISEDCVDAPVSLNPKQFTQMVKNIREAEKFL